MAVVGLATLLGARTSRRPSTLLAHTPHRFRPRPPSPTGARLQLAQGRDDLVNHPVQGPRSGVSVEGDGSLWARTDIHMSGTMPRYDILPAESGACISRLRPKGWRLDDIDREERGFSVAFIMPSRWYTFATVYLS